MAGTRTASLWPAVSTAVAVLTAERAGSDDIAAILGGQAPPEVAEVLAAITNALLAALSPGDGGAELLQRIGLVALAMDAEQTGHPA